MKYKRIKNTYSNAVSFNFVRRNNTYNMLHKCKHINSYSLFFFLFSAVGSTNVLALLGLLTRKKTKVKYYHGHSVMANNQNCSKNMHSDILSLLPTFYIDSWSVCHYYLHQRVSNTFKDCCTFCALEVNDIGIGCILSLYKLNRFSLVLIFIKEVF